jgi:hypothetical protein
MTIRGEKQKCDIVLEFENANTTNTNYLDLKSWIENWNAINSIVHLEQYRYSVSVQGRKDKALLLFLLLKPPVQIKTQVLEIRLKSED